MMSLRWSVLRIDEFYAYDNQVGPFARLRVVRGDGDHLIAFKGSWKDRKGDQLVLNPLVVIVPVYNKIRLSFTDVYAWTTRFHRAFAKSFRAASRLEWDIHLTSTNDYKATIGNEISTEVLEELRFRQHPRFIWRVRLRVNNKPALEMLADATDISHSFPIYGLLWKDKRLMERSVNSTINDTRLRPLLAQTLTEPFLGFLESGVPHTVFLRPKSPHRDVY